MSEDLAALTQTVQILVQTVQTQVARSEQLFKMQEEVLNLSRQSITDMKMEVHAATLEIQATREDQTVALEALHGAISDVDAQIDDLAKITVALLQVQKQLQPSAQQTPPTTA